MNNRGTININDLEQMVDALEQCVDAVCTSFERIESKVLDLTKRMDAIQKRHPELLHQKVEK